MGVGAGVSTGVSLSTSSTTGSPSSSVSLEVSSSLSPSLAPEPPVSLSSPSSSEFLVSAALPSSPLSSLSALSSELEVSLFSSAELESVAPELVEPPADELLSPPLATAEDCDPGALVNDFNLTTASAAPADTSAKLIMAITRTCLCDPINASNLRRPGSSGAPCSKMYTCAFSWAIFWSVVAATGSATGVAD